MPATQECQRSASNQIGRVVRVTRRFKSAGHAHRILSPFGIITSHFRVGTHLCGAGRYPQKIYSAQLDHGFSHHRNEIAGHMRDRWE